MWNQRGHCKKAVHHISVQAQSLFVQHLLFERAMPWSTEGINNGQHKSYMNCTITYITAYNNNQQKIVKVLFVFLFQLNLVNLFV